MPLFRRLFKRKPHRLLEISKNIYVFDCCFSTVELDQDEYKVYIGAIAAKLKASYRDSLFFKVYNFKEGDSTTQISSISSEYNMTVTEYPQQYGGCSVLPLETIDQFLKSCEFWLSLEGEQGMILVHCERGGWPVLAFMLAALLLNRNQDNGVQKTLEMTYKHAPKELLRPLNSQPSQLRYLQYITSVSFEGSLSLSDTPLALDYIIIKFLPLFGERGCRPVIRIFGQNPSATTNGSSNKLLFASAKTKKRARYYKPEDCELVKIDIHRRVHGDMVLECVHLDAAKEEMIFRVMFHTTFVRSNVLILGPDDVDIMWDARDQMPKNFKAKLSFSDADSLPSMISTEEESEDENETETPATDEEFIDATQVYSQILSMQDSPLSEEIKVDPKNDDTVSKEESEQEAENGDVTPFPGIMVPFLKEFEHLKLQLKDIKSATDNFCDDKVIGRGGFGKVYLGELSHSNGKSVGAFKRLDPRHGQGDPEFWKEILMLSGYKHENLISLLGFCDDGGERILVYEYASNGSLDRHLNSTRLTWRQRIQICLDAARGLSFLHDDNGTMQRVIHRDIKSSNILLDDNWIAKVSDMGLSKIGPANQPHTFLITRNIVGTPGYCDPQYMNSYTLSKESDVYSFGVVLFEVLCGRLCCNYNNGQLQILVPAWKKAYKQKKLHEIVFRDLTPQMESTSLETFSGIAFQCLQKSREERPTIAHVVELLENALECHL